MKRFAIVSLTAQGLHLARQVVTGLAQKEDAEIVIAGAARWVKDGEQGIEKGAFLNTIRDLFQRMDCLICIMATGIVVRAIAGLIHDKRVDPAVIVIDERGHHVISLLSGHVGGANSWTKMVAGVIGADPVITTATDTENVQALDLLAKQVDGWYANFKNVTKFYNARLANHQPVELYIEPYLIRYVDHFRGLTLIKDVRSRTPAIPLIIVSDRDDLPKIANCVQVIPRLNVLGVGCRKNVPVGMVAEAFVKFCAEHHRLTGSFGAVASIDVKQHEPAIQYLAQTYQLKTTFYPATALKGVGHAYPGSDFVVKTVGVRSVACAAADLLSGGAQASERFVDQEVTMAMSQKINR